MLETILLNENTRIKIVTTNCNCLLRIIISRIENVTVLSHGKKIRYYF